MRPVIICPFSRTGDETAGETAEEVALNLAAGTRIFMALRLRNKNNVRPCPDVWTIFRGYKLSQKAREALGYVAKEYARFRRDAAAGDTTKRQVAELEDVGCPPGGASKAVPAHHPEPNLAGSSPALPSTAYQGGFAF